MKKSMLFRRSVIIAAILFCISVFVYCDFANAERADRQKATFLHLEILTPHDNEELKSFYNRTNLALTRAWFVRMPEAAQLGEPGIVLVRFRLDRGGVLPNVPPSVEKRTVRKPLVDAALDAARAMSKTTRFPEGFSGPTLEFRATFFYNQPVASAKP